MRDPLDTLVQRLDRPVSDALDAAAAHAARRARAIEIEHLLAALAPRALAPALSRAGLDGPRVARTLRRAADADANGPGAPGRPPPIGRVLHRVLREAWLVASLEARGERIPAEAILLVALELPDVRSRIVRAAPLLAGLDLDLLRAAVPRLGRPAGAAEPAVDAAPDPPPTSEALARYATDLTAQARDGGIDPIIGRDREIRQVIDILARRRQNNPILVGEAGVGKTAVVEGLARRIAADDVPPSLRGIQLWALDLAALQAGASLQGEFEQRLEACIAEARGGDVVLFIDEAHTLIGAGGAEGRGDAANLLKPALARGALRTVAATTWAEYTQHIEPDAALTRRFQPVRVDEPAIDVATDMLRAIAPTLEAHHDVAVLDGAIVAAVRLSARYVPDRKLPDKAIAVLDTACARVALGQRATPAAVEAAARRVERLEAEVDRLERENATVGQHRARLGELIPALEAARTAHAELTDRWQAELALAERILEQSAALAAGKGGEKARRALLRERESLAMLQGERPMVPLEVDRAAVAAIIEDWTGIPAGELRPDARAALSDLRARLGARVIGQAAALDAIDHRLQIAGAGLQDPDRPLGVFLLAGPSGVGKTETAIALADALFGGADGALITINLSEYQEPHSVSGLRGAPPGYVGYGRGGVLTEAVRRRPYCVVLLDEMEKAHPDVAELFFQVFDKGALEDGQGTPVDFRHAVILATSNAADDAIVRMADQSSDAIRDAIAPALLEYFPPALLGRMTVVPYRPLGAAELTRIAALQLDKVARRFTARHGRRLDWTPAVPRALVDTRGARNSGARTILQRIDGQILPRVAAAVLAADVLGDLRIGHGSSGFTVMPSDAISESSQMPSDPSVDGIEVRDTAILSAVDLPDG